MRLSGGSSRVRRIGFACGVAAAVLAVVPLAALAAAGGTVFGGTTSQGMPVVIETSRNGRKVVRATIGIRLPCTSGAVAIVPDGYANMTVNRQRRFGTSFGPVTTRNDDGTSMEFEGAVSGAFNKARTKASGRWSLKVTERATGDQSTKRPRDITMPAAWQA